MTKKNIKSLIIPIIILLILVIYAVISGIAKKPDYNTTPGNLAGNLNNNGLFCEDSESGIVYFSNSYDGGALYSMKSNESDYKKINSVSVQSLNQDKNRIYYSLSGDSTGQGLGYIRRASGMFGILKNGTDTIAYTQDPVEIISCIGDKLYFQHYTKTTGTDLDVISKDKKNLHTVVEDMVSPACVSDGSIYFAGATDDMYLRRLDLQDETNEIVYKRNMYSPILYNNVFYYIDLEGNYNIRSYDPATGEDKLLTDERVDCFNIASGNIFYQRSSALPDPALIRMSIDGSDKQIVSEGIFCDINVTTYYVYFRPFDNKAVTYHTPVSGGIYVEEFTPEILK